MKIGRFLLLLQCMFDLGTTRGGCSRCGVSAPIRD